MAAHDTLAERNRAQIRGRIREMSMRGESPAAIARDLTTYVRSYIGDRAPTCDRDFLESIEVAMVEMAAHGAGNEMFRARLMNDADSGARIVPRETWGL